MARRRPGPGRPRRAARRAWDRATVDLPLLGRGGRAEPEVEGVHEVEQLAEGRVRALLGAGEEDVDRGVSSMATRPWRAFRYLSASFRSRLFLGTELSAFSSAAWIAASSLFDGRGVGVLVVLDLLADLPGPSALMVSRSDSNSGVLSGRGRRAPGELVDAHRDRRGGILEGDVADRLAADLRLGPLQGLGVDPAGR